MSDTKNTVTVSIDVAVSICADRLLCHDCAELHESIEAVAGRGVMSHAIPLVNRTVRPHLFEHIEWMRDFVDGLPDEKDQEWWADHGWAWTNAAEYLHGSEVEVPVIPEEFWNHNYEPYANIEKTAP